MNVTPLCLQSFERLAGGMCMCVGVCVLECVWVWVCVCKVLYLYTNIEVFFPIKIFKTTINITKNYYILYKYCGAYIYIYIIE